MYRRLSLSEVQYCCCFYHMCITGSFPCCKSSQAAHPCILVLKLKNRFALFHLLIHIKLILIAYNTTTGTCQPCNIVQFMMKKKRSVWLTCKRPYLLCIDMFWCITPGYRSACHCFATWFFDNFYKWKYVFFQLFILLCQNSVTAAVARLVLKCFCCAYP